MEADSEDENQIAFNQTARKIVSTVHQPSKPAAVKTQVP
jgi:hypothetical protein